ncbi:MAG: Flp pilus assembly complex ATPase component TadA [Bacteriovoracaceae bacterium]|nr:Flp pilus assembly complex ATPase component TadA [Bacteriovoracaceae bacterium]
MKLTDHMLEKVEGQKDKIGQLLLDHTALSQEQLGEALEIQKESGRLIGEILLKKNYIHPHDIVKVICHQVDIPYVTDVKIEDIDPELTVNIPISYAKNHEILPIMETDYSITLLMTDPFNFDVINDLHEIFKKEVKTIVTSPLKIQDAINRIYEKANKHVVESLEDEFDENLDLDGTIDILDSAADEAPVIRFVNTIIFRAVKERASDIHIEPGEKEVSYRFRINGVMQEVLRQPVKTHAAVSSRIKVMAKLDIAEKRIPQDGRIPIQMAGKNIDIRLNTVPLRHGERLVMRILEKNSMVLNLESLGFEGKALDQLDELSKRKNGVLYVTGPTGSGKTTTLAAVLDRISDPEKMIITVEDPVEYDLPGISQVQVNHKVNLTFATALKAFLRQDPDVMMVGETRDFETAKTAIEASLTGHFVLSTLHTNDAASAPNRLIDMGVEPYLISSSLVGVLAQRLVRTLCHHCRKTTTISEAQLNQLGIKSLPADATPYEPVGCAKCNDRGYGARTVVAEFLVVTDEIKELIQLKADAGAVKKKAVSQGMATLRQNALLKFYRGVTSMDEILRVINEEEEYPQNLTEELE